MSDQGTDYRVVALPGEGVGLEVTEAALQILHWIACQHHFTVQIDRGWIGAPAVPLFGSPFPDVTAQLCQDCDGILLGAVSQGLLELRQHFDFFANLRPVSPYPGLIDQSPLQPDRLLGVDLLFVRELVSGIYFGAAGRSSDDRGSYGYHTMQYHDWEIERIARVALQQARSRRCHLTIAHKENALPQIPWVRLVQAVGAEFPAVTLQPMLVDNLAMQLILQPQQFDVILAGNLLGDILSDLGGVLVGSIGLLGSASLNAAGLGLYEPIHGTAPNIAGQGIANPFGAIQSVILMLQQWGQQAAAAQIQQAIQIFFDRGYRTADLNRYSDQPTLTTQACIDQLIRILRSLDQSI
ncbi:MAG: isocitrate/isopropylmalate family dehydrogenase [Elainella sp. Prado103]|jgi:3-isopropylmalate dehydrogenase/3-benzylmalate dehydrogenase|nr:isocitrate/isopropylmalate family dehydrogenase [Elainella sp. Prado103]